MAPRLWIPDITAITAPRIASGATTRITLTPVRLTAITVLSGSMAASLSAPGRGTDGAVTAMAVADMDTVDAAVTDTADAAVTATVDVAPMPAAAMLAVHADTLAAHADMPVALADTPVAA